MRGNNRLADRKTDAYSFEGIAVFISGVGIAATKDGIQTFRIKSFPVVDYIELHRRTFLPDCQLHWLCRAGMKIKNEA